MRRAGTAACVIDTGQPWPGLGLRPDQEAGGAPHVSVRAGPGVGEPGGDGLAQQPVPGGMELHLVDAVAVAVVRAQHRRVLVGLVAPLLNLRGARGAAQLAELLPDLVEQLRCGCRATASVSAASAPKTS